MQVFGFLSITFSLLSFVTPFLFPFDTRKGISPFRIETREIRVQYPPSNDPLLQKINGFYGLIGPDIDTNSINSLYELFTGDGMIQGIFFDNGKMTFVKHFVRTEKLLFESIHGRFSKNIMMTPIYVLLHKMGCLPNVLGLANTALFPIDNHVFALFERDYPYQIHIDYKNKKLSTIKKVVIPGIPHFSGHSKYDRQTIHTIDYDVLYNTICYIRLNRIFGELSKTVIPTKYIPILHDFALLPQEKGILYIDAPFVWDFAPLFRKNPVPVKFDVTKPAYICLYDTTTKIRRQIPYKTPFYIFHYAYLEEVGENIDVYAPLYDKLDFSSLQIEGKYRKIRIGADGKVVITKNAFLENMNLDFPQKWGKYVVLRSIDNFAIKGFVVCKGLDIIRKIRMPSNRFFCGEPSIIEIDGAPYLVGFSYDSDKNGYVNIIGIFNDKYVEQCLGHKVTIGFHSVVGEP